MDFASRFLGGYGQGRADKQQADAQAKQEKINMLLGQAYADPAQRDASLAQAAPLDFGAVVQAEQAFGSRDDRINKGRANLSRTFLAMPPEGRARFAQQFAQDFQRLNLNPADPNFEQIATGYAQLGGGDVSVRSSFVGADGNMYSIMSDGSVKAQGIGADRKLQAFDVPGVGPQVVDLRNATARTVTSGGAPAMPPQQYAAPAGDGMAAPTGPVTASAAEQIAAQIEAAQGSPLDPAIRAQIIADVQRNGGRVDTGSFQPTSNRQASPSAPSAAPPSRTLDQMSMSEIGGGAIAPQRPAWVRPTAAGAGPSAPSGYRFGPDGQSLVPIPGGPADKKAESKPLPVGALRLQLDAQEAVSVSEGVDDLLAGFEAQIEQGVLDLGPAKNLSYQARNMAGASTPESQAYASFTAGLEKLRNDSLRLNKGVQTDGDAQRAWNELMANINDGGVVKKRLQEIRQINARGERLQREKLRMIDRNYSGKEAAAPEDDISDLLQLYGDDI